MSLFLFVLYLCDRDGSTSARAAGGAGALAVPEKSPRVRRKKQKQTPLFPLILTVFLRRNAVGRTSVVVLSLVTTPVCRLLCRLRRLPKRPVRAERPDPPQSLHQLHHQKRYTTEEETYEYVETESSCLL